MLSAVSGFSLEDDVLTFALYVAALCHDVDHCGTTNQYLIATGHVRSLRYRGFAPQEMHHASIACELISEHRLVPRHIADTFKCHVASLILSTNIASHDAFMADFDGGDGEMRAMLLLKCADLGHAFAPLDAHVLWVDRLQAEFYAQGDKEKVHGFPVAAMFDRESEYDVSVTQPQFFRTVVVPLFALLFGTFGIVEAVERRLDDNLRHWDRNLAEHRRGATKSLPLLKLSFRPKPLGSINNLRAYAKSCTILHDP